MHCVKQYTHGVLGAIPNGGSHRARRSRGCRRRNKLGHDLDAAQQREVKLDAGGVGMAVSTSRRLSAVGRYAQVVFGICNKAAELLRDGYISRWYRAAYEALNTSRFAERPVGSTDSGGSNAASLS